MEHLALYLGVWAVGVLLAGLGVMLCWNATLPRLFPACRDWDTGAPWP